MRIRSLKLRSFKRFHDLSVNNLPGTAKLIVLIGPNGSGKSSLFDAFTAWHSWNGGWGTWNEEYHCKKGSAPESATNSVKIEFHDPLPSTSDSEGLKKTFYVRSAYRNEPEFTLKELRKSVPLTDDPKRVRKLIENDIHVSDNYQRLIGSTVASLYGGGYDSILVRDLKEMLIGEVRSSMLEVFEDLVLSSLGEPLEKGSFFFEKGASKNFHYQNLSGGEKAAFDLLLDVIIKRLSFDNTVYCIDEPDLHMHTRLQGKLLGRLFTLIPENCQLWLASHSIGMVRKAKELQQLNPGSVVFLDFHEKDFDQPVTLRPAILDREAWARILSVALDDLANLIAPAQVVLCEGRPQPVGDSIRAEFDAGCYRQIFGVECPETDFISVGNAAEVTNDQLQLGKTIQALVSGTKIIRVIDRDDRSDAEIASLRRDGVRILSKRHLESYLMDDEILQALAVREGKAEKHAELLESKARAIEESVGRGNPPDDIKSAAGRIYTETKRILQLTRAGNTVDAFCRDTLAPLVRPGTRTYEVLKQDIFGA